MTSAPSSYPFTSVASSLGSFQIGSDLPPWSMFNPSTVGKASSPISLAEFNDKLLKSWLPSMPPTRIGLAVSGGIDSMVLSKLCVNIAAPDKKKWKRANHNRKKWNPEFHAFIVDHKARIGSHEEAHLVSSRLRKLGLRSTILPLPWPDNVKPAELPDFETQARKLRYRALGVACRDLNIRSLLLAHHLDDVAESMLRNIMHLGTHPAAWNLRAMGARGVNIPDCWGLHGVHQSGAYSHEYPSSSKGPKHPVLDAGSDFHVGLEEGGIKVYRPLLFFTKARIQATCEEQGLEWVEDETNYDVTRTMRNAVRSLLKAQRLPRALSTERLTYLNKETKKKLFTIEVRGAELFQRADILMFDVRSGALVIRLPRLDLHCGDDGLGAMAFLRHLLEMVTPNEKISISSIDTALQYMFDHRDSNGSSSHEPKVPVVKFCHGGVQVERKELPAQTDPGVTVPSELDPDYVWILTREGIRRFKQPERICIPATDELLSLQSDSGLATQENAEKSSPDASQSFPSNWSSWKLWDGRFWIRVSNNTGQNLEIRAFQKPDMTVLVETLPEAQYKLLLRALAVAAPDHVRWTLPVIAIASEPAKVLAFPTLGNVTNGLTEGLDWEVRFKQVDFKGKKLEEGRIAR